MANTWTCARCSAQNEEAAVACVTCGLIRGGVVVATDAAQTGAPAMAPNTAPSAGSWPATSAPVAQTPPADGSWPAAGASGPQAAFDPTLPPPPVAGAPAPGGWPGAPVSQQPQGTGKQAAKGLLANVGVRLTVIVGFLVVGGIVAFFVNAGRDSNGTINKAGEVPVTELRVGDCWDPQGDPAASFDENAVIEKTQGKPCTESHHYEVYYVGTMAGSSYPTDAESKSWAQANCVGAFQAYVGTSFDQSSLAVVWFIPDEAGWKQGDRGAQCSLEDGNHKALTQSMKNSGY